MIWVQSFECQTRVVEITIVYEGDFQMTAQVFQLVIHVLYFGLEVLSVFLMADGTDTNFYIHGFAVYFGDDALHLLLCFDFVIKIICPSVDDDHVR